MRADVKKELIQTEMRIVLEAVTEAEAVRQRVFTRVGVSDSRLPAGVELQQIQRELYNEDNGIVMTDLNDTTVRDRLNRLIKDFKLFSEKRGRERIYMTPETSFARADWMEQQAQKKVDREDRVAQLSADLGYEVRWESRYRSETVVIKIDDLEAIAQKI